MKNKNMVRISERKLGLHLWQKIAILVSGLIVAIMLTVSYFYTIREAKNKMSETKRRMGEIAKNIASLKLLPDTDMTTLYNSLIMSLELNREIVYIGIFDNQNNPEICMVKREMFEINTSFNDYELIKNLETGKITCEGLQKIEVEIGELDHSEGLVKIGFSLLDMEREIITARKRNIVIMSIYLILGIIASVVLARTLTKPIEKLVLAMKKVSEGKLDQTVSIKSYDEIGMLGDNFNFMTEGLREREFIKDTFQRYISKQVAEKILASKDKFKLGGEKRKANRYN